MINWFQRFQNEFLLLCNEWPPPRPFLSDYVKFELLILQMDIRTLCTPHSTWYAKSSHYMDTSTLIKLRWIHTTHDDHWLWILWGLRCKALLVWPKKKKKMCDPPFCVYVITWCIHIDTIRFCGYVRKKSTEINKSLLINTKTFFFFSSSSTADQISWLCVTIFFFALGWILRWRCFFFWNYT